MGPLYFFQDSLKFLKKLKFFKLLKNKDKYFKSCSNSNFLAVIDCTATSLPGAGFWWFRAPKPRPPRASLKGSLQFYYKGSIRVL